MMDVFLISFTKNLSVSYFSQLLVFLNTASRSFWGIGQNIPPARNELHCNRASHSGWRGSPVEVISGLPRESRRAWPWWSIERGPQSRSIWIRSRFWTEKLEVAFNRHLIAASQPVDRFNRSTDRWVGVRFFIFFTLFFIVDFFKIWQWKDRLPLLLLCWRQRWLSNWWNGDILHGRRLPDRRPVEMTSRFDASATARHFHARERFGFPWFIAIPDLFA